MIDMLEWERGSSHQGGSWLLEEFLQVKRTLAVLCMNVNQSTEAPALLQLCQWKGVISQRYAVTRMYAKSSINVLNSLIIGQITMDYSIV